MQPERRPGIPAKLVGAAALAAGVLLNPLLAARLLFHAPTAGPPAMHAALWVLAAACAVFGVAVLSGKATPGPRLGRVVMAAFAALATLFAIVVADRLVGKIAGKPPRGLIFPPHSEIEYETPEFRAVLRTNRLGFRGGEVDAAKGDRYRIVAIGDSFTMGWGVDVEDSWPAALERELRRSDPRVEVLNLGQGGADPVAYARNAVAAVPVLGPDLVLVGVLQGDDLFQLVERTRRAGAPPADLSRWKPGLADSVGGFVRGRLFPNLLGGSVRTTVTGNWRATALRIEENLDPGQRERFERMDAQARAAFLAGGLNPIVVQSALLAPDYYARFDDPASPDAVAGIGQMADALGAIARVARQHGGRAAVASIPYRAYVSARDRDALRQLGYAVPDALGSSNGAADAVRRAASRADLECFDVTPAFREECRSRELYYRLDGHFNAAGNAFFAERLAEAIRDRIRRGSR
jgi:lysophospholipase L1-like esterase